MNRAFYYIPQAFVLGVEYVLRCSFFFLLSWCFIVRLTDRWSYIHHTLWAILPVARLYLMGQFCSHQTEYGSSLRWLYVGFNKWAMGWLIGWGRVLYPKLSAARFEYHQTLDPNTTRKIRYLKLFYLLKKLLVANYQLSRGCVDIEKWG